MKKKPQRILLFDSVPLDLINQRTFIKTISVWVSSRQKRAIFYLNAHGVLWTFKNSYYLHALNAADLIYPDGWGPILLSRFFGHSWAKRVNAADFIEEVLARLNKQKAKLYLLGCEEKTLVKTVRIINKKYQKITISGFHHGFFSKSEEGQIVAKVRRMKPDVVLVGMGVPKQELWVHKNWQKLPRAVYWTVGGLFYYISGLKSRAPLPMRRIGLEWLYRLFQEPRRLWWRYTIGNLLLLYHLFFFLAKRKKDYST